MGWLNVTPVMLQIDVRDRMERKGIHYDAWRRIMLPCEKPCIIGAGYAIVR